MTKTRDNKKYQLMDKIRTWYKKSYGDLDDILMEEITGQEYCDVIWAYIKHLEKKNAMAS